MIKQQRYDLLDFNAFSIRILILPDDSRFSYHLNIKHINNCCHTIDPLNPVLNFRFGNIMAWPQMVFCFAFKANKQKLVDHFDSSFVNFIRTRNFWHESLKTRSSWILMCFTTSFDMISIVLSAMKGICRVIFCININIYLWRAHINYIFNEGQTILLSCCCCCFWRWRW